MSAARNHNRAIALRAAERHGINPRLFMRQMRQEAGFQDLTSPAGAQGPAQIMPATARSWGVKNVHDPHEAYDAAARNMATYLHQFGGSWAKALTAYNAGPGAVGGHLPAETQHYIETILGGGDHVEKPRAAGKYSLGTPGRTTAGRAPQLHPGGTETDNKAAMLAALLDHRKGESLMDRFRYQVSTGHYTTTTDPSVTPGKAPKYLPGKAPSLGSSSGDTLHLHVDGTAKFEGKTVAAWIRPALEFARKHGWKGSITSGLRTDAEQTAIYKSGVRPAALPKSMGGGGSNHEGTKYPRGAVDVSDAAQLHAILKSSKWGHLLVWAGAKDPVHFSHPHGGSY